MAFSGHVCLLRALPQERAIAIAFSTKSDSNCVRKYQSIPLEALCYMGKCELDIYESKMWIHGCLEMNSCSVIMETLERGLPLF